MNTSRTPKRRFTPALVATYLSLAATLHAATWQWTNTATGDFLVAANWTNTVSPYANGVPGSGDTAINNIPGSTVSISTGDAVTVGTIQAQTGAVSMTGGTLGTSTTVQVTGSNGLFSVGGGVASLANLQITGNYGTISISGGTTTVTSDSRIGAANGIYNVSGGVLNLSKLTLGSAAASNTNNVMTVSGNGAVNQNQTGSTGELWIGGNNAGSGTLILKNSATWTNNFPAEDIEVGRGVSGGTGVFTIQDSAIFYFSNVVTVAQNASGSGAVGAMNLNGGTIFVTGLVKGTGTGTVNINGGTISALNTSANFLAGFTSASGNNAVNILSGGLTFNNGGKAVTITNFLSGAGGFTSLGAGTNTLSGATTYTGPTVASAGTLATTTASTGAGSYTVADGATLQITAAAVGKSLTNSSLALGVSSGSTVTFALGANGSMTVPVIADNGALTVNGTITVNVSSSATLAAGDVYPLIAYASLSGSGTFVAGTLPPVSGYVPTVTNNAASGQVELVYVPLPAPKIKWAVGSGAWDTTTTNWAYVSNNSAAIYAPGDYVSFDDTASGPSPIAVTLAANVSPATVSNVSTAIDYTFLGVGNITNAGLLKDGTSTLVLDNGSGNNFLAVTINNGTLQVGNDDTNGSLGAVGINDNGALAFNRTDNITLANTISGVGSLVQNGADTLTLINPNTFTGDTVINNGQIIVSNSTALQNSPVSNNVVNGLGFGSGLTAATIGGLDGSADLALTNAGGSAVTISDNANAAGASYAGSLTVGSLVQVGTNVQAISGNSTVNALQINGSGTLAITGGNNTSGSLQILANGGSILVSAGNTTITTDSRIAAANCTYTVSGGTLNLSKLVLGSAASGNTNNLMVVSGSGIVNQNQTGSTGELWIGGNNGGSGSLLLENSAGWTNSFPAEDIVVGRGLSGGTGVFSIQDNASFYFSSVIQVAQNLSGTGAVGTVNLNGGSTFVTGFLKGTGLGTINANGGTVFALAGTANFFNGFTNINLFSNGLAFDDEGNDVIITNNFAGAGGFTKLDSGDVSLTASNTYTGPTIVNGGTLDFGTNGTGSIRSSSSITVNNATLVLSNQTVSNARLSLTNATISMTVINFPTNIQTGALSLGGSANAINLTGISGSGQIPLETPLIKYTSLSGDPATFTVNLPASFTGYLTNNAANKSIDLVLTGGSLAPVILTQPVSVTSYQGYTARWTVVAEGASGYEWQSNGMALNDGPGISGSATNVLTLASVSSSEAGNYDVIVSNSSGSVTSSVVSLTVLSPDYPYISALLSGGFNPVAVYEFDDMNNPATNNAPVYDYVGSFNGIYGPDVQNGYPDYAIAGPRPTNGYPGFSPANWAAQFLLDDANATVTVTPWNLDTNAVTLTAWVNPSGLQAAFAGLIFCRGNGDASGFDFTASTDGNGNSTLGYAWNNDSATYGWNSTIAPPAGQWSFVALTVTPTNATIYVINTNGMAASTFAHNHGVAPFAGTTLIGGDSFSATRSFSGVMDEVAVFNSALTPGQLTNLYYSASSNATFAPAISLQPQSVGALEGTNIQLTVDVVGTGPFGYQWQFSTNGDFENLADGGAITGSMTAALSITNVTSAEAGSYQVIITNAVGAVTSAVAVVTVETLPPANEITFEPPFYTLGALATTGPSGGPCAFTGQQGWSQSTSTGAGAIVATTSSGDYVGGQALGSGGSGVAYIGAYTNLNPANAFQFDVSAQGSLDKAGLAGWADLNGDGLFSQNEIGVFAGIGNNGSSEQFVLRATGLGTSYFDANDVLNSSDWYRITVALDDSTFTATMTIFDLTTNGLVDTFSHPFASAEWGPLASSYLGFVGRASANTLVDNITALVPPKVNLQLGFSGTNLRLTWSQGQLLQTTNLAGPWTTNTSANSPYTISPTNPAMFYKVQVQ